MSTTKRVTKAVAANEELAAMYRQAANNCLESAIAIVGTMEIEDEDSDKATHAGTVSRLARVAIEQIRQAQKAIGCSGHPQREPS